VEKKLKNLKILNAVFLGNHLGLTPQSIYKFGTYTVRPKKRKKQIN
jgi:ketopantoate hydroxymethyltransferase